jgi:hypothetical protein
MSLRSPFWRQTLDVGCEVEIDHSPDNLGAHVRLDGDPEIGPGDRVRVYGEPIDVKPGDHLLLRRRAIVERATPLGRLWTRFTGHFEMAELYDVSFTDRSLS